ncbi:hypothetical protein DRQ29_05660 [bacterium]|nr:MAG: hypothetical protein DRQ29_05660 [bacterium]
MKVRPIHIIILMLLAVSARFLYFGNYIGHDDSYIYLNYAKNISSGNGWSFNDSEPTYGTTSPLWTIILALGDLSGIGAVPVGRTISYISLMLLVLFAFLLGRKVFDDDIIAFAYASAIAIDPWILRWSGTIMETTLGAFSSLLFIYLLFKIGRKPIVSFLGGVMVLIRPELGLVWFIAFLEKDIKNFIKNALFFILPIIPWIVYAYFTFGQIYPNTMIKAEAPILNFSTNTLMGILKALSIYFPLFIVPLIYRPSSLVESVKKNRVIIAIISAVFLYYCWRTTGLQSTVRYINFLIPLVLLIIFSLARTRKLAVIILILQIAISSILVGYYIIPRVDMFEFGYKDSHIVAAKWLKMHTSKSDKILVHIDIGIIGYYSERYILDYGCLVTPEMRNIKNIEQAVKRWKPKYFVHTQRKIKWEALKKYPNLHLKPVMEFILPPTGISASNRHIYLSIYEIQY